MCMRQLHQLGYDVRSVYSLRSKHIDALVAHWKETDVGAGAIQNRLSALRALAKWTGKQGMVLPTRHYAGDQPERLKREAVARTDKSWSAKGIDAAAMIRLVEQDDRYVGAQLRLIHAFGLRREEAIQFKPFAHHEGDVIRVRDGTKGGRERVVQITNDLQRAALAAAKSIVERQDGAVAAPGKSLHQNLNRFDYVMRKHGLTKQHLGVTAHGLRHQRLNDVFEEVAGVPSPVRQMEQARKEAQAQLDMLEGNSSAGGYSTQAQGEAVAAPVVVTQGDERRWKEAQQRVSHEAGHARLSISGAYTGSPRSVKKPRMDWTARPTPPAAPTAGDVGQGLESGQGRGKEREATPPDDDFEEDLQLLHEMPPPPER